MKNARTGQRAEKARVTSAKYLLLEILPQRNRFFYHTNVKSFIFHDVSNHLAEPLAGHRKDRKPCQVFHLLRNYLYYFSRFTCHIGPKKCTVSYQLVAFVALAFINLSLLDEAKKLMLNTNKDLTINFKDALLLQIPWLQSFTL
jgi:hypothetical protein